MSNSGNSNVFSWLNAAGLSKYYPAFASENIDDDGFLRLTIQDYNRFGITAINERKSLFQLIQLLKTQQQPSTQSSIPPPVSGQGAPHSAKYDVVDPYMPHQGDSKRPPPKSSGRPADAPSYVTGSKIRVVVRKRPMNKKELGNHEIDIVTVDTDDVVSVHEQKVRVDLTKYIDRHRFRFDQVFDEDCPNEDVYRCTAQPLIESVFQGGRVTCFAYGQTGSGKTFTMMGKKDNGLYGLAGKDIFQLLRQPQYNHMHATVSFFEIYCDRLFDLLNNRKRVEALEDHSSNIVIHGLKEFDATSVNDIIAAIDAGQNARSTGTTSANADSSRSHAIFQITLKTTGKGGRGEKVVGKFSFIDLAGSERGADTRNSDRQTRMEGAEINKSLLALKECIRAMDQQHNHLPFRGSKLTMVLKDSFVGENCHTVMIANVSPNSGSCENTLNTLRYADRVKELKQGDDKVNRLIDRARGPVSTKPKKQLVAKAQPKRLAQPKPAWRGVNDDDDGMVKEEDNDDDEYDNGGDDEQEDELARTHEELITRILDEEDEFIAAHRQEVEDMMELVKKEMQLLAEVEEPGSDVDAYVKNLDKLLLQKIAKIEQLRKTLIAFQDELKMEETMSKTRNKR
ncbi:putative Diatom spindle kinesin-1 [Blattamonas nauphoetae]|uniref:Kinesin-like protein n=1 Tax=Blattamonas nauphoetae TaxID=2049346 RepID=A0ABQ9YM67_9EUKA|nr:putative Diatom spindle kinesin-1 [Blattamonas nauphoetae]